MQEGWSWGKGYAYLNLGKEFVKGYKGLNVGL